MAYLEVKHLSKSFGDEKILDDINFTLEKSEILVIVGPSGGGKSTLLRCLNDLEEADEGEIDLKGKKTDPNQVFGLVFQQFQLFPQYTALENVTLAPRMRRIGSMEEIEKKGRDLLSIFGLEDRAGNYPHQLSGGQKQRVALARALILDPKVLCLDEPTSALDPALTDMVKDLILSLKARGMTLIVVTHDLPFGKKIADKMLFLENGKLISDLSEERKQSYGL